MNFDLFWKLYFIFSVTLGEECFVFINGIPSYNGTVNVTATGRGCQRWDETSPHIPLYPMTAEHENYCRTPDNDDVLWCYTMDPLKEWEMCGISECIQATLSEQQTTFSEQQITTFSEQQTTISEKQTTTFTEQKAVSSLTEQQTTTSNEQQTTSVSVVTEINMCECPCKPGSMFWIHFLSANLTEEERINILIAEKQRLRQILLIQKTDLNSYKWSRTSAVDDRLSAQSIGIVGIIILCVVGMFFVLVDCSRCVNFFISLSKR